METVKPINFTNFTGNDFVGVYNKKSYKLPKEKTIMLPGELACHFAKHLVNHALHKMGLQIIDPKKHELLAKVSPELEWSKKRHFVVIKSEPAEGGELQAAEASVHAKQAEVVPETVQAPEPPVEQPAEKPADKPAELSPEDLTRKELDKKATEEYGCDPEAVAKAKSKADVIALMKAKADEVQGKTDEDGFEGNK